MVATTFKKKVEAGYSTDEKTRVVVYHDSKEWRDHYEDSKKTTILMVVDFTASWCAPCKKMDPIFDDLSLKYKDVEFDKIDIDELPDVAKDYGIEAMPTFVLMKSGDEVDRVVGAHQDALEKSINEHK